MDDKEITLKILDLQNKFWDAKAAEMYKDYSDDLKRMLSSRRLSEGELWTIEQIERELDSILLSYPENIETNKLKLDILLHKKQYKEADFYADKILAICDKHLEANPGNMDLLTYKLFVLDAVGRKSEFKTLGKNILGLLDSKLAIEPNNIENLSVKASVCSIMKDKKTSKMLNKRILELDPTNEEARIALKFESDSYSTNNIVSSAISIFIIFAALAVYVYTMFFM